MPGRHSPPLDAPEQAAEKLTRPTTRESHNKKDRTDQHFPQAGTGSITLSSPSLTGTGTPDSLSAPALPPQPTEPSRTPTQAALFDPENDSDVKPHEVRAHREGIITVGGIDFHHESEAEFARLLDYYGIEWQYEPHQFPLQWRDDRPTEMFSPDFYLTEYDLYIELTTMRQSLVRRKNRKLRLLRALYPEINIKLLYRRDYQRLLERFGIRPEEIEAEQQRTGGFELP